ncbi:hypothetical protein [Dactylosporangium sp. CA-092794]|uniref:hypothetical protein n=1 Tax=Dactylosporangium sp. CA-092794 TaxID=3239929 RepID=UPI003D928661
MDGTTLRVDRADVRQTDDEHTLILSAAGVYVMLIRLRYAGRVDEVINSAGTAATWPVNAWTLVDHDHDHDLALELDQRAAATFGCASTSMTKRSSGPAPHCSWRPRRPRLPSTVDLRPARWPAAPATSSGTSNGKLDDIRS